MRCLIVEDCDFVREMMELFLIDYADTDSTSNGEEAVALFSRALADGRPYQLVCLDILMPGMNGQETLKKMRQVESAVRNAVQKTVIIMTTAIDSREEMEEALWQGECTDYLAKPIILAELVALMRKYNLIS